VSELEHVAGTIAARLAPHGADLDLLVVGADAGGGCAPTAACLPASPSTAGCGARVEVPVARGQTYYVIVDGAGDAASGYTLTLDCTPE